MISLIYFSSSVRRASEVELTDLLRVSRSHDERDAITGMLLYHGGNFFQVIEGPHDAVEACFKRISEDPSHTSILATRRRIAAREFEGWSMGFACSASLPDEDRQVLNTFLTEKPVGGDDAATTITGVLMRSFRNNINRFL